MSRLHGWGCVVDVQAVPLGLSVVVLDEVAAVASSRSHGVEIEVGDSGRMIKCKNIEHFDFSGYDIALFAAGSGPTAGLSTDALPNIWTDRATFDGQMAKLIAESGKLVGILTHRDVRFAENPAQRVSELMTKDNLATVKAGVSQDEAQRLLHQRRIEKLLVVDEALLRGLVRPARQDPVQELLPVLHVLGLDDLVHDKGPQNYHEA